MESEKKISYCMKKALSRLERSDITALGLYKYLTEKRPGREPFSKEEALETVNTLIRSGFIDDKRYLRLVLEKLDERAFGPMKIREELKKKDFSKKSIEKAMLRDIDFDSQAVKLLEKKKSEMLFDDSRENTAKLVRFLVSNGYDYQTAYSAVLNTIKSKISEE